MIELVIIWESGEKDVYQYDSYEEAVKHEIGMRMVFGNQITWSGIR